MSQIDDTTIIPDARIARMVLKESRVNFVMGICQFRSVLPYIF